MRDQLKKINDHSFELPKTGKMNVPGKIYSSENLLSHPGMSSAIKQVADVATLPGIVDSSCLLYTSPSPRDVRSSRMPSSA